MLFKDTGDRAQSVIARPQDRHLRDGEMLPGNQCQQRRRNRTENLRDENNVFATDAIGQMSGRQRKTDDWNREYEPDQPERSRRMRAPVNFPFHRDCEHLSADDRQQISSREKTKPARTERGIRIMSRRRRNDHARNFRSLTDRRFVFVRHTRAHSLAFEYARESVELPLLAATISLGTPRKLVDTLAKLLPRMYLISLSLRAHPGRATRRRHCTCNTK